MSPTPSTSSIPPSIIPDQPGPDRRSRLRRPRPARKRREGVLPALIALALACLSPASLLAQGGEEGATVERVPYPGSAPLSRAVVVDNTIYLSGALGTVPGQGLAEGGIGPETRQALENIRSTLEPLGASLEDVVKCTVFLSDFGEWGAMNEVYASFFPDGKPARSAVAVAGLALDAAVEIECVAVRSTSSRPGSR